MGGDSNTVGVGNDSGISYPHHARWLADGTLSIFDNGVEREEPTSRAVVYELGDDRSAAEVVAVYATDPPLYTATQGSVQVGGDGTLVMWSETGTATWFDPDARPIGTIDLGVGSYRLFAADWVGRPGAEPVAVRDGDDVVVSWNGATEVARWELVAGTDVVGSAPSDGFETRLPSPPRNSSITVRAIDDEGDPIPRSATRIAP